MIFRKKDDPEAEPATADRATKSALQPLPENSLQFQLHETEKTISALEGDLERARKELVEAQRRSGGTDELAAVVGRPLAHLATQVALVQAGSDALEANDLALTASGLLKALATAGISTEGEIGTTTAFDPNRHLPLRGSPATGDQVILRSPAIAAPSGQIVRQATVEPV
jgi:hypothetical protein